MDKIEGISKKTDEEIVGKEKQWVKSQIQRHKELHKEHKCVDDVLK